jgi:hypothetical protein
MVWNYKQRKKFLLQEASSVDKRTTDSFELQRAVSGSKTQ